MRKKIKEIEKHQMFHHKKKNMTLVSIEFTEVLERHQMILWEWV